MHSELRKAAKLSMVSVFQQLVLPSLPSSRILPQANGMYAPSMSLNEPLLTSKYFGYGSKSFEHADHAEFAVVPAHRLADAVRAAEGLLVGLLAEHHHGLGAGIRLRIPGAAVEKRHIEHREEVRRGHARGDVLGLHALVGAAEDAAGLVHDELAVRNRGGVQRLRIAIGEHGRRERACRSPDRSVASRSRSSGSQLSIEAANRMRAAFAGRVVRRRRGSSSA